MPVPNPRKGESEQEFIERCMHSIGGEENAIAMCYSSWNNAKGDPARGAPQLVTRILDAPIRKIDTSPGAALRVKSYAAIWGDEEHMDLYGTWFTRDTDFALDWYTQRPWLYDHTMNKFIGAAKIGSWKDADLDDHGLFFLGELDSHFRYTDEVEFLMELGWLFPSSGTLSHAMQVANDGWIRRWPIAELSSTTQPAEFRIPAQAVDASSRRRAAEAIRRLGGLKMGTDVAGALFPGVEFPQAPPAMPVSPARTSDPLPDPTTGTAQEPPDMVAVLVEESTEAAPAAVEDTPPGEQVENPAENDVQEETSMIDVQQAILSVDETLRQAFEELQALRAANEALQERVAELERPVARQVSDLVSDRHWTDRLFSATRSGRVLTNRDAGQEGDPQEPLAQNSQLLTQLGAQGGYSGTDVLSRIVASQQ